MTAPYEIEPLPRFKKDAKKIGKHREYEDEDLEQLVDDLIHHETLPDYYREHALTVHLTDWRGYLSADLSPDLRVLFTRIKSQSVVKLHRIGTHAQLYKGYLRKISHP